MEDFNKKLDALINVKGLKNRALALILIVQEFADLHGINNQDGKAEITERIKKEIFSMRMELAYNKATESNSGTIDHELGELVHLIEWLEEPYKNNSGAEQNEEEGPSES